MAGNIRELRNYIESAMALKLPLGEQLPDISGPLYEPEYGRRWQRLDELEKQHIRQALALSGNNKSQAALLLGISRRTPERKIKRWNEENAA